MAELLRILFLFCLIVMIATGASVFYLGKEVPSTQITEQEAAGFKAVERAFEEQDEKSFHPGTLGPETRHNLAASQYGGVNPYEDQDEFAAREPLPAGEILRPHSDPYEFQGLKLNPIKP